MGRPLSQQILQVFLLSLAGFLVFAAPAWFWTGAEGLAALGVAAGICFLGAAIGRLIAQLLERLDPAEDAGPRAVQAATAVRVVVTLMATLPVFLLKPFPMLPFVVWLAANYVVHLALEVFVSLRHLGQNAAPSESVGSPTAPVDRTGHVDLSDPQAHDNSNSGVAQE